MSPYSYREKDLSESNKEEIINLEIWKTLDEIYKLCQEREHILNIYKQIDCYNDMYNKNISSPVDLIIREQSIDKKLFDIIKTGK